MATPICSSPPTCRRRVGHQKHEALAQRSVDDVRQLFHRRSKRDDVPSGRGADSEIPLSSRFGRAERHPVVPRSIDVLTQRSSSLPYRTGDDGIGHAFDLQLDVHCSSTRRSTNAPTWLTGNEPNWATTSVAEPRLIVKVRLNIFWIPDSLSRWLGFAMSRIEHRTVAESRFSFKCAKRDRQLRWCRLRCRCVLSGPGDRCQVGDRIRMRTIRPRFPSSCDRSQDAGGWFNETTRRRRKTIAYGSIYNVGSVVDVMCKWEQPESRWIGQCLRLHNRGEDKGESNGQI